MIVHSDLLNSGMLWARGGNLTIDGNVSGGGSALFSGNATMEFGAAFDESVMFDASASGTLRLDHSADFSGVVSGFDGMIARDISNLRPESNFQYN